MLIAATHSTALSSPVALSSSSLYLHSLLESIRIFKSFFFVIIEAILNVNKNYVVAAGLLANYCIMSL